VLQSRRGQSLPGMWAGERAAWASPVLDDRPPSQVRNRAACRRWIAQGAVTQRKRAMFGLDVRFHEASAQAAAREVAHENDKSVALPRARYGAQH